jgi:hypothetical protein
MKNEYWIWRTKDFSTNGMAYHVIADWDVNGKARTDETYPVFNLHRTSYSEAIKIAIELGFRLS